MVSGRVLSPFLGEDSPMFVAVYFFLGVRSVGCKLGRSHGSSSLT